MKPTPNGAFFGPGVFIDHVTNSNANTIATSEGIDTGAVYPWTWLVVEGTTSATVTFTATHMHGTLSGHVFAPGTYPINATNVVITSGNAFVAHPH